VRLALISAVVVVVAITAPWALCIGAGVLLYREVKR
jgi:hypothetical protein